EEALENVEPRVEVRGRRIGGMTYQVPTEVSGRRQVALGIRWLLEAARSKKGRPLQYRLADEIMDAYNKQGSAYQRRESLHRMAEANRAFSHFGI
ncbi:MAG: 30S ribosomal protein S7, partial [Planctomycetota bacterium]